MADDIANDHALLREAASEAARLALTFWKGPLSTSRKADGSIVTNADLAVDALLESILRTARPDYGWLSEESAEHELRLSRKRVWALDPIDGTRAFVQGRDDWTIALSLLDEGSPILSVIVNPVREETFEARRGTGAFLNGERIAVSDRAEVPGARLSASDGVLKKAIWNEPWPELDTAWAHSLAYRFALVACGRIDAALALNSKSEWDVASGALLVQEAGGAATLPSGKELRFNSPEAKVYGFLAAAPKLHQILVGRLEGAQEKLALLRKTGA